MKGSGGGIALYSLGVLLFAVNDALGKWLVGSYGVPEGLIYGFPVTCNGGEYKLVRDLPIDEFSRQRMDATLAELEEERAGIAHLLG